MISTHLDDAVWSATGLIGDDTTLVTICAGIPEEGVPAHEWGDTQAGFETAREAMLARRVEDLEASKILGFTPIHLDAMDEAYGMHSDIGAAVEEALTHYRGGIVAAPLGLGHFDHNLVNTAFMHSKNGIDEVWFYEDQPYAKIVENRRALRGRRRGFNIVETRRPDKEEAVLAYKSQIRPDTHLKEILGMERYWKL